MKKESFLIVGILTFSFLLRAYIGIHIPFDTVAWNNLLNINNSVFFNFLDLFNIFFLWLLIKKHFSLKVANITAFVYSLAFWTIYGSFSSSPNILITNCLLLTFLVFSNSKKLSLILILLTVILFIGINLKGKPDDFVFSNPAIINSINTNRGVLINTNLSFIGKILENKVTYLGRITIFNLFDHFSPVYYFTPQNRLLNFSFTPPILVGFLIPFLYGIKSFFEFVKPNKKIFALAIFLIIPSLLSYVSPNIEKLLVFVPLISLIISLGIIKLFENRKRALIYGLVFVVLSQFFVTIYDISTREQIRFNNYYHAK